LTDGVYDLLVKSIDFGPSLMRVGFVYPTDPTQTALSYSTSVSDVIDLAVSLPVKTARTPNWDASTCFTTSVTTVGGRDEITYTWQVGTQPDFLAAGVLVGDVGILSSLLTFLPQNKGFSALLKNVSSTFFTLELPKGRVTADAITWDSIDNTNGVVTFTKSTGHGIVAGNRFGTYNTAILTGSTRPFDSGSYSAITASSTQVTALAPAGVPGGAIQNISLINNIATVTAANHNLNVANIVKISSAGSPYDGTYPVLAVLNANQFQYILNASASPVGSGRFDFQTIAPVGTISNISSISRSSGTVTVNTSAAHGLTAGQPVSISGVVLTAWSSGTYSFGDVVRDLLNNQTYKCIVGGPSSTNPSLDPTRWASSSFDLTGTFTVSLVLTPTEFQYIYNDSTGTASGTGGVASGFATQGSLARAIGGDANLLSFAQVGTTQQEVVDFLSTQSPIIATAQIVGGTQTTAISKSTEDLDVSGGYLSGTVTNIQIFKGSRRIKVTTGTQVPAGSELTLSIPSQTQYNGKYTVLSEAQVGGNYVFDAVSEVISDTSSNLSVSGTFVGSTPFIMMVDGDNSVLSDNLGALPGSPQFQAKRAWVYPPDIGEELRLITTTEDQLSRFWNRLVVTGVSNVSTVTNARYGREIQIETDTFGSGGSVQVVGGSANSKTVALVGASSQVNDKLGFLTVPYDLRRGIVSGTWMRAQNTVRENRQLGFTAATRLQVFTNGIGIDSLSPGSFQTKRTTTPDNTTTFNIEYHGSFLAFVCVAGSSLNLTAQGVREGDWVRITNSFPQLYDSGKSYVTGNKVKDGTGQRYLAIAPSTGQPVTNPTYWTAYTDWSSIASYSVGQYALFNGRLWYAAAASTGKLPGSDTSIWEPREFSVANVGIFRVVRVFGEDAFWVENPNGIEEVTKILDPNDLTFYSPDSVMPGDTLVITGPVLGLNNDGRYTVQDDQPDGSSFFPTATRIYTTAIPQAQGLTLLGLYYGQINIEEGQPISLLKRVFTVGPYNGNLAAIMVDSPELTDRLSSANGGYLSLLGKMNYPTTISFGLDGYKAYAGLVAQLNKVIYGDPTNPVQYPGVRAGGTAIGIKPALTKRVQVALAVRTKIGIDPITITNQIQASVAAYVRSLDVGQPVSISSIVSAAGSVNGVTSVAIVSPTYNSNNDLIAVGAAEKAAIVDSTTDVVVSILGT
jgi:hypothetical protein